MKILDATCGMKSMWYQKNHPLVTYIDIRKGTFEAVAKHSKIRDRRKRIINPDVVMDFTDLKYDDDTFDMVIFDPPYKIEGKNTKEAGVHVPYGRLNKEDYKDVLSKGINELFRVLKPCGVFVFKWGEINKKVDEIIKLFPYPPMFGTRTGQRNNTHWIVFLKYDVNIKLDKLIN